VEKEKEEERGEKEGMEKMGELKLFLQNRYLKTRREMAATELAAYTQDVAEEEGGKNKKIYDNRTELQSWKKLRQQSILWEGCKEEKEICEWEGELGAELRK
jgi:hypothetical protein